MEDKRRPDDKLNNRQNSSVDDYEILLSEYTFEADDDDDAYIDISSDSSRDVYIGRKNEPAPAEDVYISRKRTTSQSDRDIYSYSDRRSPEPSQQPVRQSQPVSQAPHRVSDKYNTGEVKRASTDNSDEYSDFEERTGISPRKKRKKVGKGFIVLAVLLAIVIGVGGAFYTTLGSIVGEFSEAEEIEHIEDVDSLVSESHVRNILLIGTDKEKGGSARSDSMMIASVNKQTGKITVVSILRDTHLDIPGEREAKVNAAYAWGGANLLIQTIEQNFGIKIDDYATVNFEMFTALVDGLGGIEVEVTENEADYINNRHSYGSEEKPDYVESGESVHLNGYQALWYARIRKLDSDFNRTERQRKVISAIVDDAKEKIAAGEITELLDTAKGVAPYIETTLSTADFMSLMTSLVTCFVRSQSDTDGLLVTAQLPFDDTWEYSYEWDGSSISIDLEANKELLYELLYEGSTEMPEDSENS